MTGTNVTSPDVTRPDVTGADGWAVVAGATGAIGAAIVGRLRDAGLTVVAIARSATPLEQLAAGDEGIVTLCADVGDDSIVDAIAMVVDGPVRMVVQSTGLPAAGDLDTITGGQLATGIDVKVGGFLRLIRGSADHLGPGSRLVVLGGHYGFEPTPQTPLAGMANAALANLVRMLADRYGPAGITTHLVAPGPVDSPRMRAIAERIAAKSGTHAADVLAGYRAGSPLGRLTSIDEVAWAVGLLLSPHADALHGSTLSLDLGRRRGIG